MYLVFSLHQKQVGALLAGFVLDQTTPHIWRLLQRIFELTPARMDFVNQPGS